MAARPLLCILGPKPHLSQALRVRVHKLVELMALFWRLELDDLAWKDGALISGRGIFLNAFAMNARREKQCISKSRKFCVWSYPRATAAILELIVDAFPFEML